MLRHDDTVAKVADALALQCAEYFWESLEGQHVPLKEIMTVSGERAVQWAMTAYAGFIEAPQEEQKEEPMKRQSAQSIGVGPNDGEATAFTIVNAQVRIKDGDGYKYVPVQAQLEINHVSLLTLVRKAAANKSKQSTDGALTVYVSFPAKESHEPDQAANQEPPGSS
jgi:hypothetical protein